MQANIFLTYIQKPLYQHTRHHLIVLLQFPTFPTNRPMPYIIQECDSEKIQESYKQHDYIEKHMDTKDDMTF